MEIRLNASVMTIERNDIRKTCGVVWVDDNKKVRGVLYCIAPNSTQVEVWEDRNCISTDLGYAMGYLRGAGFTDETTFEEPELYGSLSADIDEQFGIELHEPVDEDDDVF